MNAFLRRMTVRVLALLFLHACGAYAMMHWRVMEGLLAGGAGVSLATVMLAAGFIVLRLITFGLVPGMILVTLGAYAGEKWRARKKV